MFCPKCGNEIKEGVSFCPKCGTKVASNQENFQQNNYKSQNYGQKPHVDKKSLFTKQSVGLIVGILLMAYGAMDVSIWRIDRTSYCWSRGSNYVLYKILK